MGSLFEWIIVILFVFAILDLMVGVANDAVNFLNSAIGSKVSSRKVIFGVASVGILLGALSSSGMMEVARKGIFNPEMFSFWSIMIIFVSVVITDVLLLDFYNTLRLPTSTTVSIVFELLGAAVAVSMLHVLDIGAPISEFLMYINRSSASDIVSSILLSVGISFSVGMIVQYIVRFFFTYSYKDNLPKYGALFGGIAITAITYFLLIKGIKDSSLLSKDQYTWIKEHTRTVLSILFIGWTALLQLGQSLLKRNIPKIIVLIGTFALAAAFAGNDLVNFIGVSMAGFNAYQLYMQAGGVDPSNFMMDGLAGKVPTQFYLLAIAGIVMIVTLRTSRKAASVTETEIGLTKEQSGNERFSPGPLSRALVRWSVKVNSVYETIIPVGIRDNISARFEKSTEEFHKQREAPAFDLIRASVNLTVASILIAIATSMKLPLSTTYVTFMVAMGTALADGVWGRESAVYRVTGVLTVIGGWFMTAISAFVMTALVATAIWFGGSIAIGILVALAAGLLWKTHMHHAQSVKNDQAHTALHTHTENTLIAILSTYALHILPKAQKNYAHILTHITQNKDKALKKDTQEAQELTEYTKTIKNGIHNQFVSLPHEALDHGDVYVQAVDYLRKITTALEALATQSREYALNQHPDLIDAQKQELTQLEHDWKSIFSQTSILFEKQTFGSAADIQAQCDALLLQLERYKKNQLTRIKENTVGVRNTTLYLTHLLEAKNIAIAINKLITLAQKL